MSGLPQLPFRFDCLATTYIACDFFKSSKGLEYKNGGLFEGSMTEFPPFNGRPFLNLFTGELRSVPGHSPKEDAAANASGSMKRSYTLSEKLKLI